MESSKSSPKRLNGLFSNALSKLSTITRKRGLNRESFAYENAEKNIIIMKKDITSHKDLIGKRSFGPAIIRKLGELEETGTIQYIEDAKTDPVLTLTNVHGIGSVKAKELITKNITTIDDLKEHSNELTIPQNMALKYYDEIQKRIPREIIEKYENKLNSVLSSIDEKAELEIAGSYRRNLKTSGDIDIIVTHSENTQFIFSKFLNILKDKNIITGFLSRGNIKSLTITQIEDDIHRRTDFIYSPPDEYPFALLYFTGSKNFNTVMRNHALKMGYSMNEHGLYRMINGKKENSKIERIFKSEKEIFSFLNLEYKEPEERTDGNSVVLIKKTDTDKPTLTSIMNKMTKNISCKDDKSKKCGPISAPSNSKFYTPSSIIETKTDLPYVQPSVSSLSNKSILKQITEKLNKNKSIIPIKEQEMSEIKDKKRTYKQLMSLIEKDEYNAIEQFTEDELALLVKKLNESYYNKEPAIDDIKYDVIKNKLMEINSDNKVLSEIGAPVNKQKAKLPYFMASMDKIKPDTKALEKWMEKYEGDYVISAKLDGVSGLYTTMGDEPKLYTRGNGEIGQDVSYLIPYFKLPSEKGITLRGEFIIQKELFENNYAKDSSNARNFVAGVINAKRVSKKKYEDLDFVAYEVIEPKLKPSEQMEKLLNLHVDTVLNENRDNLTNDDLSDILLKWRDVYKYDIDGIIVIHDEIYERENKNPEHAFAFKMVISDQVAEATVLDVLWEASKDGYLKPRIRIEPITLGGVKIEYATAFNAAFVEKHKLGFGAIVKLVRSGDVIPHILDVVTPSSEAKFPNENYSWNENHIDIILDNKENNITVRKKNIEYFFSTVLKVDNMGPGIVKKLAESEYNTIAKILEMTISDFKTLDGIQEKTASKIYNSIESKIESASLVTIMAASNIFGHSIGEKKIKIILQNYSNVLLDEIDNESKIEKIKTIKGMGEKTPKYFVENIPKFLEFLKETKLSYKLEDNKITKTDKLSNITLKTDHELYEKNIVFTGFRDKKLMDKLENEYQVNLTTTINKNTYLVIAKDPESTGSKILKAKTLNIPVFSKEEFEAKYPDL